VFVFVKRLFGDFLEDECPLRAAALAYYTVFALPPLLILLVMLAGAVWDSAEVQRALEVQFSSLVGAEVARTLRGMLDRGDAPGDGWAGTALGIGALLFGATGAFMQLQGALNRVWHVEPDPARSGVVNFLLKRLLSLGMIMAVAFLLVVSLAVTAVISALGARVAGFPEQALQAANLIVSFAVVTALFAAMFRFLPDTRTRWRDVWVGAVVTSLLFTVGKFAIGLYLGRVRPGSAFGTASALAVILVWIYYAGIIVLLGAEFTRVWAARRGARERSA
jgi:membrane protein